MGGACGWGRVCVCGWVGVFVDVDVFGVRACVFVASEYAMCACMCNARMPSHLRSTRSQEAMVVHKLFRMVFLGLGAAEGEVLLAPHLARLLDRCLERVTQEEEVFG